MQASGLCCSVLVLLVLVLLVLVLLVPETAPE
jgi:hypothetical protein